ncbi:BTB domain-containing protein [Mycena chlorophos]|uniref:BTB domain-containing protein n=1 Tax=Mycena chlorophos TaxID=658473 RepID=A0A8H6SHP3_MYCCL|nr:BTB domain-containing protein [Mycena chlorophos]
MTDAPTSIVPLERVAELWFEDGTLVIVAQQTAFKVHRSILAARSSVFRDMLAMPQNADFVENLDGCPMVVLSDAPRDLICFLRAIFDSSYFMPSPHMADLSEALSILRLSHKYAVDYLFRRALTHLDGGLYFRSFHDFHERPHGFGSIRLIDGSDEEWNANINSPLPFVLMLQAAVEVDAPWLQPVAVYWACSVPLNSLMSLPIENTSRDTLQQLVQWRTALMHARAKFLAKFAEFGVKAWCSESPSGCLQARLAYVTRAMMRHKGGDDASILEPIDTEGLGFCTSCAEQADNVGKIHAIDSWAQLPRLLGLPTWLQLGEQRKAVLAL